MIMEVGDDFPLMQRLKRMQKPKGTGMGKTNVELPTSFTQV